MDNKILDMINTAVARLPARSKEPCFHEMQYDAAKKILCDKYPGREESEYICKAIAEKYDR